MGILDDMLSDPVGNKRRKLLEGFSLAQLRQLAKENDVELKAAGFFSTGESLRNKDDIVTRLWQEDTLSTKKIEAFKAKVEAGSEPKEASAPEKAAAPMTPTLASSRSPPLVSFEEVVGYLEQYRFISRYAEEAFYEVELAGALRERFGTVVRQNPVPVLGKRLVIDLDVGGVGIEIKANVSADKPLRDALGQLADYRQHYGEKLVFLLIGTHGLDARKNEIRQMGVVFIEK